MSISQSPRNAPTPIPPHISQSISRYPTSFSPSNSLSSLSTSAFDSSSSSSLSFSSHPSSSSQAYPFQQAYQSPVTASLCDTPAFSQYSSSYSSRDCSPQILTEAVQRSAPHPAPSTRVITRKPRFTMGPRADCEKCRLGVPGHYMHFD
jgi:hypothetical protein